MKINREASLVIPEYIAKVNAGELSYGNFQPSKSKFINSS